jgi:hypothetical protein
MPGVNLNWIENRNEIFYSIAAGTAGFGLLGDAGLSR